MMITFSTRLTIARYFFSNFFRLKQSAFFKIWIILFIILVLTNIRVQDFFYLTIVFLLIFGTPVIKWFFAKKYKALEIKYFFNNQEFGYSVADLTTSVKINQIKSIQFYKNCIWIICNPSKILFIGEPEDIVKVYQQLLSTDYAKFITQPKPNADQQ